MDRKGFERIVAICACALLALAVASLFYLARDLILPVFLAVFIALVLQPIVRRFCRLGMNRPAAAVATMLILFAILFGGGYRLTGPPSDGACVHGMCGCMCVCANHELGTQMSPGTTHGCCAMPAPRPPSTTHMEHGRCARPTSEPHVSS